MMKRPMRKSCRLLHATFPSSERRVEPVRRRAWSDRAMEVPIMNRNLMKRRCYYYMKKLVWSKDAACFCPTWGRGVQNNSGMDTLQVGADYQGKTKSATVRPAERLRKSLTQDVMFCGG